MGFDQYHVQQLNGSDNQGYNCAAASLATQIRILTDNRLKPGPEQLRGLIHDARDKAGLMGTQVKEAYWDFLKPRWRREWGKIPPFRLHQNDEWQDFLDMLDKGFTAHTQLQYSEVPAPYRRRLSNFQGPHAVLTIKRMVNKSGVKGFLVSDPLKSKPIFWPEEVMKDAAFTRSGNGYIDAAYVRRAVNPPDVDETPDPVDEVPVPDPEPPVDEIDRLTEKVSQLTEQISAMAAEIEAYEDQNRALVVDASQVRELARAIADREVP